MSSHFFLALPVTLAVGVLLGLHRLRPGAALIPALVLGSWFGIVFALAQSGVLANFSTLPPRVPLLALLAVVMGVGVSRVPAVREALVAMPGWWPVALQTFRAPLEVGLYLLFTAGLMPEQMTFAGRNFDVLVGVTAPVMASLIARDRAPRGLQFVWHAGAIALLLNVVGLAISSVPGPLHADWPGTPLTVVAQWPYVLLPAFLVPLAALGHLAAIAQLRRG